MSKSCDKKLCHSSLFGSLAVSKISFGAFAAWLLTANHNSHGWPRSGGGVKITFPSVQNIAQSVQGKCNILHCTSAALKLDGWSTITHLLHANWALLALQKWAFVKKSPLLNSACLNLSMMSTNDNRKKGGIEVSYFVRRVGGCH